MAALPPPITERRSDEREVFALINALRRQVGGGVAPVDAQFWVSTADATLTSEVNMGSLGSGILQQTVALGVATPSILTMAGTSVLGRAAGAAGLPAAIAASADGQVLNRSAGALTWSTLGAASVPALDAHFWTDRSEATLANEVNLGALATGVLQHTVTAGVSAPSAFAVGTGLIPFGNGSSLLATSADLSWANATGLLVDNASTVRSITIQGNTTAGVNMWIKNTNAANSAFASQVFVSDAGHRADVYFTSSTYAGADSLPSSLTIGTDSVSGSVIFSPQQVRVLRLTNPDAYMESGDLNFILAGTQVIEKQSTGDFYVGTLGAQLLGFYTNNVTRHTISSAGASHSFQTPNISFASGAEITPTAPTIAEFSITPTTVAAAATVAPPWSWDSITQTLTGATAVTSSFPFYRFAQPTLTDATGVNVSWVSTVEITTPNIAGSVSNGSSHVALDMIIGTGDHGGWSLTRTGGTNYDRLVARYVNTGPYGAGFYIQSEAAGTGVTQAIYIDAVTGNAALNSQTAFAYIAASLSSISTNATSGSEGNTYHAQFSRTSSAGMVVDAHVFRAPIIITSNVNITTATGVNATVFKRPTYDGNGTAKTADRGATVYIENSPSATNSLTLTQPYSLWIDAGILRYDGAIALGGGAAATLGTIGGGGPGTAAQNKWIQINVDGTAYYIPLWV